eukprot:scaffold87142_cov33-Attheya_sp.AAC.1
MEVVIRVLSLELLKGTWIGGGPIENRYRFENRRDWWKGRVIRMRVEEVGDEKGSVVSEDL